MDNNVSGLSPLAAAAPRRPAPMTLTTGHVYRSMRAWGAAVHCTGSGIVTQALGKNLDPFEHVMEYYGRADTKFYAHYVVGFDGQIGQVVDEHEDAQHIGFLPAQRQAFLSGAWANQLPPAYVASWRARWPGRPSPAHLFPGASPNQAYVGLEMLVWQPGCGGTPRGAHMLHTDAQHEAAARLTADIARRWGWPPGWSVPGTGRVAAHEDLNPLDRTSGGQGWDPGVVRELPYFDWPWFAGRLAELEEAAAVA